MWEFLPVLGVFEEAEHLLHGGLDVGTVLAGHGARLLCLACQRAVSRVAAWPVTGSWATGGAAPDLSQVHGAGLSHRGLWRSVLSRARRPGIRPAAAEDCSV